VNAVRLVVAIPFGLIFGSFNTVAIHRIPRGESVAAPRSRCPVCGTRLRNVDNIPVVSWLLLRGRCRSCGARISPVYPLTELATAGLFAAAALTFDRVWVALMMGPFLGLMVVLAVIDIRHRIIPNRLVYPSFLAFAAYIVVVGLLGGGLDVIRAAIGMLAYGGALLVGMGAIVALIAGASRKNAIPFGPFLAAGALLAAFLAPQISSVYLRYVT